MLTKRSRYTVISPRWGHTFRQSLWLGSVEGWHPGLKDTQAWGHTFGQSLGWERPASRFKGYAGLGTLLQTKPGVEVCGRPAFRFKGHSDVGTHLQSRLGSVEGWHPGSKVIKVWGYSGSKVTMVWDCTFGPSLGNSGLL